MLLRDSRLPGRTRRTRGHSLPLLMTALREAPTEFEPAHLLRGNKNVRQALTLFLQARCGCVQDKPS